MIETDVLVIGSGAAGLSAAEAASRANINVLVIAHGEGASPLFSGVNIPATEKGDTPEIFAADMFEEGRGINDPDMVASFTKRCVLLEQRLRELCVPLEGDRKTLQRRLLAGGSYPRGVYYRDIIGKETIKALRRKLYERNVRIILGMHFVGFWYKEERIFGAYFFNGEQIVTVRAKATVLAAGGIGSLYPFTTYPQDVDGSGIAAAYLAGAQLIDMEFIQFEPTVILGPPPIRGHLILTAMLGEGGFLLNAAGERFMQKYDPERQERAHKDVLTKAILEEVKKGHHGPLGGVYFDGRGVDIASNYPEHYQRILEAGIDLKRELIEVGPAAHSIMGGIRINTSCETTLQGFFAAGEVTGGLHGASRLAGNGAADALVNGEVAGVAAAYFAKENFIKPSKPEVPKYSNPSGVIRKIRQVLQFGAPVVRDADSLQTALSELYSLQDVIKGNFYEEMALKLSEVILYAVLQREESRGYHLRRDFPQIDPAWQVSQIAWLDSEKNEPSFIKIRR